MFEKHLAGGKY